MLMQASSIPKSKYFISYFMVPCTDKTLRCYCNGMGIVNGGGPAPGGEQDCQKLCSGNKAEYCGGSSRLNVYFNANGNTGRVN